MPVYVVSDLHLHDEPQPFLFTEVKERAFVALVDEVLSTGGELICAGDVFDLTGMSPPRRALREFFLEAVPRRRLDLPRVEQLARERPLTEQLAALHRRYPQFFAALRSLALQGRLTLIPGNHDCSLNTEPGRAALASLLELPAPLPMVSSREVGTGFLVAHGHQFDPSNSIDQGCENPGAVITSAMYRALMPALTMLGVKDEVVAAVPAVRPEEEIASGIRDHLSRRDTKRLLIALVRLLYRNGYFHGVQRGLMRFVVRDVPVLSWLVRLMITPLTMRAAMANDRQLKEQARLGVAALRHGKAPQALPPGDPDRTVVLGHTHVLDHGKGYVNLGTWIDHVTGFSPRELRNIDPTMPVLRVADDGKAALYDAEHLVERGSLEACEVLWRPDEAA